MNIRRNLLIVLGAAPFAPRSLFAQSKQPILIGWLSLNSRESGARFLVALKEGLAMLGWKDGSQVRIEARWAEGQDDRLACLTQELAAQKSVLIVASGDHCLIWHNGRRGLSVTHEQSPKIGYSSWCGRARNATCLLSSAAG